MRRDEGSERYYADHFQQGLRHVRSTRRGNDWIAFEHEFQQQNLAEVRKFPLTP